MLALINTWYLVSVRINHPSVVLVLSADVFHFLIKYQVLVNTRTSIPIYVLIGTPPVVMGREGNTTSAARLLLSRDANTAVTTALHLRPHLLPLCGSTYEESSSPIQAR